MRPPGAPVWLATRHLVCLLQTGLCIDMRRRPVWSSAINDHPTIRDIGTKMFHQRKRFGIAWMAARLLKRYKNAGGSLALLFAWPWACGWRHLRHAQPLPQEICYFIIAAFLCNL